MQRTEAPESGVRGRTRRAILDASAAALARDRAATLADIAAAAGVGRSTLQRYFPDRVALLNAVVTDSLRAVGQATADAALGEGSPLEAMRRLITAMVGAGDRVLFLYGDPRVLDRDGETAADGSAEVIRLIERGQAAGVFDPQVGAAWIAQVLWALVYAGCDAAGRGTLPRPAAAATVIRAFESGVRRAEGGS
jgi:AcrR family transcriptional regulator